MPAASIQFSQTGSPTGGAGNSVIGYLNNTNVVFTDTAGGGATSWAWSIVSWPGPLSSPPTVNNSTTQTANATPTTDGVYIVQVIRTDPGPVVTTDTKFFAIGDADYGYYIPSPGQTGNMTNVAPSPTAAQAAGWWGRADGNNVWIDAILRFLRSGIGRYTGQQATVNFAGSSTTTVTVVDGVDKPYRLLNLTGTGLYVSQIANTSPVPLQGKRFQYLVKLTAGSGGFNVLNGVAGPVILALVAPPSGTLAYNVEVIFDGTNWFVSKVALTDPLAIVKVEKFYGVAGLQTTNQTVATRIGAMRVDPTKYPANAQVTFQVMLDTTGPQATIQLYNLTDSGIVAGSVLTTTSTTTVTLTSGALTIPNAVKDYEVQLFMAAGISSDHVDCTRADLRLTWG
jgi:hypothetical protein